MKVRLSKPIKKIEISHLTFRSLRNGQLQNLSSPQHSEIPSSAYRQELSSWLRTQKGVEL